MANFQRGIAVAVPTLALFTTAVVLMARPPETNEAEANTAVLAQSGNQMCSVSLTRVDDSNIKFAATDKRIERIIASLPTDGRMNLDVKGVLRKFKLDTNKLQDYSCLHFMRLIEVSWQVSPSYWLKLSYGYAFPKQVQVTFHKQKPLW